MKLFSFIFGDAEDDAVMSESKGFRIKYDGEALADHSIEIAELVSFVGLDSTNMSLLTELAAAKFTCQLKSSGQ